MGVVISGRNISATLKGAEAPRSAQPSDRLNGSTDYAYWGTNNDLPNKIIEDAKKSTIITPSISIQAAMLYGAGVGVKELIEEDGNYSSRWIRPLQFRQFYKKSMAHKAIMAGFTDIKSLGQAFFQISLNDRGDQIQLISTHKTRARMIRLGKQDSRGVIKTAYINADWGTGEYDKTKTQQIRVINNEFHPAEWLREYIDGGGRDRHFLYPIRWVSIGAENYYSAPDWNAARTSKVTNLAEKTLAMKAYYVENATKLKYHVEFHPEYWSSRYGKDVWGQADDAQKLQLVQDEVDRIDDYFSGVEGGNVFASQMLSKIVGDELASSVRITEFKQTFHDGIHTEDINEAAQHLLFASGLHSSSLGAGAKQSLSGNGSENRVVYEQRKNAGQYYRDEICALFEMIRDYNKWPNSDNWEFCFRDFPAVATADQMNPEQRDAPSNEPEE